MAIFGTGNPTLLDQIKRTDPDGKVAKVVEALTERNPILMDATFQEGNLPTGHRLTIRSGLPTVGWRKFNEGIAKSKSTTIQVDETCGMLEGRSVVDCKLAKLNGNEAAFRASEDRGFLQSLNIEAANALFFANTKIDPEKIHGFTPRFDSLSGGNSDNIVNWDTYNETGTVSGSDQYSIWFITWGPDTCYGIYPKGSQVGISSEDLGKEYEEDPNDSAKKFLAWRTHWNWDLGLCVKDWRYIVRICNIDSSAILVPPAGEINLINAMVDAYNRVFDFNAGRTVIYCNRQVLTWLDLQVIAKSNMYFYPVEWHGKKINSFRGIPIVTNDALRATESEVT